MDEKRYLMSVLICIKDEEKEEVQVRGEIAGIVNSLEEDALLEIVKDVDVEQKYKWIFKFWKELSENEKLEDFPFEPLKGYEPEKNTGRYAISVTFNLPTEDGGNIVKEILEEVESLDYDGVRAFLKLKYPEIQGNDYYVKVIKELEEDESMEMFEGYRWIVPSNFDNASLLDIHE